MSSSTTETTQFNEMKIPTSTNEVEQLINLYSFEWKRMQSVGLNLLCESKVKFQNSNERLDEFENPIPKQS